MPAPKKRQARLLARCHRFLTFDLVLLLSVRPKVPQALESMEWGRAEAARLHCSPPRGHSTASAGNSGRRYRVPDRIRCAPKRASRTKRKGVGDAPAARHVC